jgi:hypothetical protein
MVAKKRPAKKSTHKKRTSSIDLYFIHKVKSASFVRNTLLLTLVGLFTAYFTSGIPNLGYIKFAPPRDSLLDLPILWVSMALVVVLWYIYAKNNIKTNKKKKRL